MGGFDSFSPLPRPGIDSSSETRRRPARERPGQPAGCLGAETGGEIRKREGRRLCVPSPFPEPARMRTRAGLLMNNWQVLTQRSFATGAQSKEKKKARV